MSIDNNVSAAVVWWTLAILWLCFFFSLIGRWAFENLYLLNSIWVSTSIQIFAKIGMKDVWSIPPSASSIYSSRDSAEYK